MYIRVFRLHLIGSVCLFVQDANTVEADDEEEIGLGGIHDSAALGRFIALLNGMV